MAIFTISNGLVTRDLGNLAAVGYNYTRREEKANFKYDCVSVDTNKFKSLFIEFGYKGLYLDYITLVFSKATDFHNLKGAIQVRLDLSYANIPKNVKMLEKNLREIIYSAFNRKSDKLDRQVVINHLTTNQFNYDNDGTTKKQ